MTIIEKFESLIWRIIYRLGLTPHYISRIKKSAPWVFVSYIPEACYRYGTNYLNGHQNRREMKRIVKVFNSLGFNVYVGQYDNVSLPDISTPPTVIFGLEPAFERACTKWPNAMKIYYATGASFMHQNGMIKKRTDEFNKRYNPLTPFPYQRLTSETERYVLADYIFQIGSEYTVETYPKELRTKIKLIRQSNTICNKGLSPVLDASKKNKKVFLSLVSFGPILKGVDLLIDYFREHGEYVLHLCGPIENDFWKIIGELPCNIIYHGFMDTASNEFKEIASEAMYMIYPSCTEGMPGSVINCMYYGCIPIVSKWAAVGSIKKFGFLIEDLNISSISKTVEGAQLLSERELIRMCIKGQQYVIDNYTLDVFESDLRNALKSIL